jgi:hypothetical protein
MKYKWTLGEDGWNTGMDSNLLALDTLVQCSVISAAATTPPESPTLGDSYIPAAGATDAWLSLVGDIVIYDGATWVSITPKEGWVVYDNNTNKHITYHGATWSGYTSENVANKSTSTSLGTSDTLYPSQKAVKSYVDTAVAAVDSSGNTATVFERSQKFGNHSYIGSTTPVDGPYNGSAPGSTPLVDVTQIEALTNRGNIADCALWEMNSNTINTSTAVALYSFVESSIYPMSQWRTGAKMQYLASLALYNVIPTSENFVYRIGLANGANSNHRAADPWAGASSLSGNEHTGCAAMFIADNTSTYWQCKSGRKTDTQTTVTAVPYVLGEFAVFHIVVTTTGAVEFRINGTLVATHSGSGIIPDGAYLNEGVAVRNIAATTTAKKGFYLDQFAFRHTLPGTRTGYVFT